MKKLLIKEKSDLDKMLQMAKKFDVPDSGIIKLNVGGGHFSATKSTLVKKIQKTDKNDNVECYEPHLLQLLVSGIAKVTYDENKEIFIDRNPQYFGYLLDYLRSIGTGKASKLPKLSDLAEFFEEAEFYNLQGLLEMNKGISSILNAETHSPANIKKLTKIRKFGEWGQSVFDLT
jgi:hypothetical protein